MKVKSLNPSLQTMMKRELLEKFNRRKKPETSMCFTLWKMKNTNTVDYIAEKYSSQKRYLQAVQYMGKRTTKI